jgi:hypothetical protein
VAVALVFALATVPAGPAAAQAAEGTVVGRPAITLSAQETELRPGERNTLSVLVGNDGDIDRGGPAEFVERVTTARNLRLSVAEDRLDDRLARAIDVRTGTVLVGSVGQGVTGPVEVELDVADSLRPGTYEIPVLVEYDYTTFVEYGPAENPTFGDGSRTELVTLEVVVEDQPRFEVTAAPGASVVAGETGAVAFTVRNTGSEPAADARIRLSTADTPLFFGSADAPQSTTTALVPQLGAGETTQVEVAVGTGRDTRPGTYPVAANVSYEDTRGVRQRVPATEVGVAVGDRQRFGLAVGDAALSVGAEGTVSGTVTNTADRPVEEAVLVLEDAPEGVRPLAREVPLGTIAAGGEAEFAYRLAVSNGTSPGARQLNFRVRYRDAGGDRRTSDRLETSVVVGREQTFAVTGLSGQLRVGWTGTVEGRLVNTGDRPVTDATVVLAAAGTGLRPRSTAVAVGDLGPGEPASFSFTVDVANDTDAGERPLSLRVQYRDESGDRRTSERIDGSVTVGAEQTFAVTSEGRLRAGERGTVTGTVRNTGGTAVSDAVVVFESGGPLSTPDREFAVGDLAPGERAPFEFSVDVDNRTTAGLRQLRYRVRYRDTTGESRRSDALSAQVRVGAAPAFAVRNLESTLQVGEPGTVSGTVVNTGDAAVEGGTLRFAGAPSLRPRTTERSLGTLAPGDSAAFEFVVDVPNRTAPGERPATFRVRYTDPAGVARESDALRETVDVAREQTFTLAEVTSTLRVGQRGVVAGRVVNTGPRAVTGATVSVGGAGGLAVETAELTVGDLAPGESAPFSVSATVPNESAAARRTLPVRVRYRGGTGEATVAERLDVGVAVGAEQSFALANLTSSLRVGWTGTVDGEVVNTGDAAVTDAVLVVTDGGPLQPRTTEYALGDIPAGEAASFDLTVDVPNRTAAAPRLLSFRVRYSASAETYRSDALSAQVQVGPERDPFRVRPVNATVPVDGDAVLVVEVTNTLDAPVTDLRGLLTVAAPLETEDTSAFAGRLGPGESARLRFELTATDEAIPKRDSVTLGLRYTDDRGDRRRSDPVVVPVDVTDPPGGLPVVPTAVALLAVVVAGLWWWRRR